jgi:hypothetical protein
MKIIHGRKNQPQEYYEVRLNSIRLNIVLQEAGDGWYLYHVGQKRSNFSVQVMSWYPTCDAGIEALKKEVKAVSHA